MGFPALLPGQRIVPIAGQVPVRFGEQSTLCPVCGIWTVPLKLLLEKHAALLDPIVRPPFPCGAAWLVRPDGYVACVAKKGDTKVISDYLEGLCSS